jgi:hypothetical protein
MALNSPVTLVTLFALEAVGGLGNYPQASRTTIQPVQGGRCPPFLSHSTSTSEPQPSPPYSSSRLHLITATISRGRATTVLVWSNDPSQIGGPATVSHSNLPADSRCLDDMRSGRRGRRFESSQPDHQFFSRQRDHCPLLFMPAQEQRLAHVHVRRLNM